MQVLWQLYDEIVEKRRIETILKLLLTNNAPFLLTLELIVYLNVM